MSTRLSHSSSKNGKRRQLPARDEQLCQQLMKYGWRKSIVAAKLITDMFPDDYRDDEIYGEMAAEWWADLGAAPSEAALYRVGFARAKAKELFAIMEPLVDASYTHAQWFEILIECTLGRYKPLFPRQSVPFTRPAKPVNAWFKARISPRGPELWVYQGDCRIANMEEIAVLTNDDQHVLCFHATSWGAARSISEHGILLYKSRQCLDFGIKPSFYTTDKFDTAVDWVNAKHRLWHDEGCVLLFSIPQKLSSGLLMKRFARPNREWSNAVSVSRKCLEEENALDKFDVVQGPMLRNPAAVLAGQVAVADSSKSQCAWKTENSVEYLYRRLVACMYFEKSGR